MSTCSFRPWGHTTTAYAISQKHISLARTTATNPGHPPCAKIAPHPLRPSRGNSEQRKTKPRGKDPDSSSSVPPRRQQIPKGASPKPRQVFSLQPRRGQQRIAQGVSPGCRINNETALKGRKKNTPFTKRCTYSLNDTVTTRCPPRYTDIRSCGSDQSEVGRTGKPAVGRYARYRGRQRRSSARHQSEQTRCSSDEEMRYETIPYTAPADHRLPVPLVV